jgi:hypothetical protein
MKTIARGRGHRAVYSEYLGTVFARGPNSPRKICRIILLVCARLGSYWTEASTGTHCSLLKGANVRAGRIIHTRTVLTRSPVRCVEFL